MEGHPHALQEVFGYIRYLHHELQQLTRQQMQVESRVEDLEKEVNRLREQLEQTKPIHIDTVNYKVQELSVHELKGTLTIGMSALADPKQIDKWLSASGNGIHCTDINTEEPIVNESSGET